MSLLTLSNESMCARSNSSLYLSILSAVSQSLTVATDDKSVGVGLNSGWEQLLLKAVMQGLFSNEFVQFACWYLRFKLELSVKRVINGVNANQI